MGAIGGSAGGSHDVYLAATGTKGDDRLDAAVALSGAYDFTDKRSLGHATFSAHSRKLCRLCPVRKICARPHRLPMSMRSVAPLYVIASDDETMPPEQFPDLVRKLKEVGATNFKQRLRTNSQQHSFSYWPEVRDEALDFLEGTPRRGSRAGKDERNTNADCLGDAERNSSLGGFLHGTRLRERFEVRHTAARSAFAGRRRRRGLLP